MKEKILNEEDWEKAKESALNSLKESEMIRIQAEMLLEKAKEKLKK